MFKAIAAALALSLFACAAEPGAAESAESTETSGADVVQAEHAAASARDVITVVAVAKVRPETRADFAAAAEDLVRGTRREDGNVGYTMLEAKDDPNTFIFIEEWKNQAAIDAHMNGAVLATFFGLVKDDFLPGYPSITSLDTVSVK